MAEQSKPGYQRIRYELPDPRVARVVMARPEARNTQDRKMLYEIDHAHARVEYGVPVDPAGIDVIRNDSKATLQTKSVG